MIMKKYTILWLLLILGGCTTSKKTLIVVPEVTAYKANVNAINEFKLIQEFEKTIGNQVFFAFNSYALSSQAKIQLQKQAEWLKSHPETIANIEGHCDERGTKTYNIGLGYKRAEIVKAFLVQHGIDTERLSVVSYGKEKPKESGHNESVWKQNRRAVTYITINAMSGKSK